MLCTTPCGSPPGCSRSTAAMTCRFIRSTLRARRPVSFGASLRRRQRNELAPRGEQHRQPDLTLLKVMIQCALVLSVCSGRSNSQEGSMLKPILFVTVAFALVVASTPNARAAMCFQYTKSGGGVSRGPGGLPQPNKCITFALYEVGTTPGLTALGAGTGSLCRSTQSNFVVFHYTYDACIPFGRSNYFELGPATELAGTSAFPRRSAFVGGRSSGAFPVRLAKWAISLTRTIW